MGNQFSHGRRYIGTAILTSFGFFPFVAQAQVMPNSPTTVLPQIEYPKSDENGVDLATDGKTIVGPAISIGPSQADGLTYQPAIAGWPIDSAQNVQGTCYSCDINGFQGGSGLSASLTIGGPNYESQPANPAAVTISGSIARFAAPTGGSLYWKYYTEYTPTRGQSLTYSPILLVNSLTADYINPHPTSASIDPNTVPTGDNLYGNFYFIDSSGLKYIFTPGSPGTKACLPNCAFSLPISRIIKPNGEQITYYYLAMQNLRGDGSYDYRLLTIVSSLGYAVKFNRAQFSMPGFPTSEGYYAAVAYNASTEYCNPYAIKCDFVNNWPYIILNPTINANMIPVSSYVDSMGGITSVTSTVDANINFWGQRNTTVSRPNGRLEIVVFDLKYASTFYAHGTGTGLPSTCAENGNGAPITIPCPFEHVLSYKDGIRTWNYSIVLGSASGAAGLYKTSTVNRVDPSGSTLTSLSIPSGQISTSTNELGQTTLIGTIDPGLVNEGRLLNSTYPEGNKVILQYDSRGNVIQQTRIAKPGSGLASVSWTASYPATCSSFVSCNKPDYVADGRSNRTDYTYDPVHGGLLTETLPADQNGVHPQRRFTYSQLTPMVRNASGTLVASAPVWKLTSISACDSATAANPASCIGTVNEHITEFTYGTNNLWISSIRVKRGDGAVLQTISYTYDNVGNVTSETGPRFDINDTRYKTYDKLRRVVFEIGSDPDGAGPLPRQVVHHVYDQSGDELRTEVGTGQATDGTDFVVSRFTRRTFDASDRLIKVEEVTP